MPKLTRRNTGHHWTQRKAPVLANYGNVRLSGTVEVVQPRFCMGRRLATPVTVADERTPMPIPSPRHVDRGPHRGPSTGASVLHDHLAPGSPLFGAERPPRSKSLSRDVGRRSRQDSETGSRSAAGATSGPGRCVDEADRRAGGPGSHAPGAGSVTSSARSVDGDALVCQARRFVRTVPVRRWRESLRVGPDHQGPGARLVAGPPRRLDDGGTRREGSLDPGVTQDVEQPRGRGAGTIVDKGAEATHDAEVSALGRQPARVKVRPVPS